MPSENETKVCDNCDQEIGANETACPKCKVVFAELDEDLKAAEKILEKRRKRNEPPPPPVPAPEPEPAPASRKLFSSFGKKKAK